jgi:hypothetical protein
MKIEKILEIIKPIEKKRFDYWKIRCSLEEKKLVIIGFGSDKTVYDCGNYVLKVVRSKRNKIVMDKWKAKLLGPYYHKPVKVGKIYSIERKVKVDARSLTSRKKADEILNNVSRNRDRYGIDIHSGNIGKLGRKWVCFDC